MLQLVIGQLPFGLRVVALRDQIQERLTLVVARQLFVDDLPADRAATLQSGEPVAEAR